MSYRVFVKARSNGRIDRVMKITNADMPMPAGYTHELTEQRDLWFTLAREGAKRFWITPNGELRPVASVTLMANAETADHPGPIVVTPANLPSDIEWVDYLVNAEHTVRTKAGEPLEIRWENPATVRVELADTDPRMRTQAPLFLRFD